MPQAWDVLLDGRGYMVAPGSYRRGLDAAGGLGGPPTRQVQREWRGGAGRALQAERDRFWRSAGLLPAEDGEGVRAGPREVAIPAAGFGTLARRYGTLHEGRPYVASGGALWRPVRVGAGYAPDNLLGLEQLGATLAGPITGLTSDGDGRLYLSRDGAGYAIWPVGGSAFDLTPTLPLTGCAWYAGSLWGGYRGSGGWRLARATGPGTIEGDGWPLDSAPRAFATIRDGLYIATGGGLWRARGSVVGGAFSGEVAPLASGGGGPDDFCALAEWGGDLYTWAGGEVLRYRVTASGGSSLLPTGRRGWRCRGLAAARGLLFAAIVEGPTSSGASLWAFDGSGWWCVGPNSDATRDYCWPTPTAGYFDNADLLAFGDAAARVYGWQLAPRATQPGLGAGGELITSLWHGRDPDKAKGWARAGLELAWPGGGGFAPCTVALDYSVDGGATFAVLGSATVGGDTARTLAFDLPPGAVGKWLALRYRLADVTDGAPILAALWAEYRAIETPRRRRHWTFALLAADDTVGRDGATDPRGGAAIAADLWAAWEGSATLPFRDLDYDLAPVERAVRIVGLDEAIAAPADAGRWGDSRLTVRLVEV